jgi:hypothetical protein
VGEPLIDRVLQVDGRDMGQTIVTTRRREGCTACARATAVAGSV